MNRYELMYIIDSALEEGPRKELIERVSTLITSNGGEVEKVDEWGKRRLAYPINYKNEGYYVLVNLSAGNDLPREIERVLQISEDVLRYLVVRIEQKHTSVKPRPVPIRTAFARQVTPGLTETAEAEPEASAEAASQPDPEASAEVSAEAASQPEPETGASVETETPAGTDEATESQA